MIVRQATSVAIGARAVLIEGAPGAGKSSLALALIDRGATLIGDDGTALDRRGARVVAAPPPATRGLIEVRGLGILTFPVAEAVAVALVIRLEDAPPRFVDRAAPVTLLDAEVPCVTLAGRDPLIALKAELALARYGIAAG